MGILIDGNELAKQIRITLKKRIQKDIDAGNAPCLAVVLVGDDPGSQIYVRNKEKFAARAGIGSRVIRKPADTTQQQLLSIINELNADDSVHGILVQLPLPRHLDESAAITAIDPGKDVDGIHVVNAGRLLRGLEGLRACTPLGIIRMLDAYQIPIEGKHAVVIGRSNIVGKPIAIMLMERNATVTICHSKTRDLKSHLLGADIIVAAVGKKHFVTADMVKDGAVVIDVGMNRDDSWLYGDVDFESVRDRASYITPVPGGVGPMTIAMLLENTVEAFLKNAK